MTENINDLTLYEAFLRGAKLAKDAPFLYFNNKIITYPETAEQIELYAAALLNAGIKKGDVITVMLPSMPEAVYLLYAANKLGVVSHLLNPQSPPGVIESAIKETGSRAAFVPNKAGLADMLSKMGVNVFSVSLFSTIPLKVALPLALCGIFAREKGTKRIGDFKSKRTDVVPSNVSPDDTAVLICSGGTLAGPKTVKLTSRNINALVGNGLEILGRDSVVGEKMFNPLPLFHGFGISFGLHAMAAHGGANVLIPYFHRKETIRMMNRTRPEYMLGIPSMYRVLLDYKKQKDAPSESSAKKKDSPFASVVYAFAGGDFAPEGLKDAVEKASRDAGGRCLFCEGWGLSETVSVVSVNTGSAYKAGTVGKPLSNLKVKTADDGELLVSGDTVTKGYYGDSVSAVTDESGTVWLKTGDIGSIDADGFITIRDRKKRTAKINGVTVYPADVEKAAASVHGVQRAVCTVRDDGEKGKKTVLIVATSRTDADDLKAELNESMTHKLYKEAVPSRIILTDNIPLTPFKKPDYAEIDVKFFSD